MIVASPTANTRQPHYYEGSRLRSLRDSDAVARAWLKTKQTAHRNNNTNNQQFFLLQKLARQRRRVVGGGATQTSTGMTFKGEYSGGPYAVQNVVAYTAVGGSAGLYIALQSVPAGVLPDTGNPYWFAFPAPAPGMFA